MILINEDFVSQSEYSDIWDKSLNKSGKFYKSNDGIYCIPYNNWDDTESAQYNYKLRHKSSKIEYSMKFMMANNVESLSTMGMVFKLGDNDIISILLMDSHAAYNYRDRVLIKINDEFKDDHPEFNFTAGIFHELYIKINDNILSVYLNNNLLYQYESEEKFVIDKIKLYWYRYSGSYNVSVVTVNYIKCNIIYDAYLIKSRNKYYNFDNYDNDKGIYLPISKLDDNTFNLSLESLFNTNGEFMPINKFKKFKLLQIER